MKKIMMIAALMVATLSASAQNEVGQFTLKPMVGINLSNITNYNGKIRVGLAAGVEAEYGITETFGVSGGVLYSMEGCKNKDNSDFKTNLHPGQCLSVQGLCRKGWCSAWFPGKS